MLLPCQVCWISLGASSTTLECIHVLLNKDPVVSTQTSQELPERGVRAAFTWELSRAVGIPTFKAEAPGATEECLENVVCIKIW